MIDALDRILSDLIQSRVPALGVAATQIGVEPPDDDWRQAVVAAGEPRLNIYLYELRENVKLRSNERLQEPRNGWFVETPAPPIVNCMYLVTAWSPATAQPPVVEPTRDEHALLGTVAATLLRRRSIVVKNVYGPGVIIPSGRTINSVPTQLRTEEFAIEVALTDGAQERPEFWSTMRLAWRPALKLTVALPIYLPELEFESPMVTTVSTDHRQQERPDTSEPCLTIGGHVFTAGGESVRRAYIRLQGLAPPDLQVIDRNIITRDDGGFVFSPLRSGRYRLHAVKSGMGALSREVDVPSPTGEYDLRFP
jgi:hypothetical protein